MTPEQITQVKASWEKVKPASESVAGLFYGRLFELDPSYRALFKGDMQDQGRKLMAMISTAVHSLDDLGAILPAVQQLGERHVGYGVVAADYDVVGEALLWTLAQGLGEDFDEDLKEAWTLTYTTLAGVMTEAAANTTVNTAANTTGRA
ncbi:MAG: globin family protein [Pseudomonadota bacterium]